MTSRQSMDEGRLAVSEDPLELQRRTVEVLVLHTPTPTRLLMIQRACLTRCIGENDSVQGMFRDERARLSTHTDGLVVLIAHDRLLLSLSLALIHSPSVSDYLPWPASSLSVCVCVFLSLFLPALPFIVSFPPLETPKLILSSSTHTSQSQSPAKQTNSRSSSQSAPGAQR